MFEYKKNKKSKDWSSQRFEDLKIWDSTRISNFGWISGATDKGIDNRARYLSIPEAR
jgi:hypothetical protein